MRSTIAQMEGLLESIMWQDMKDELNAWLKDIHEGLEDTDNSLSDKHLHRLGGNAEAVRHFKNMPQVMLENLVEDLDRESREGESNE